MKKIILFLTVFTFSLYGKDITYQVDGKDYQGYILKKSSKAPTVLIIHDWDGLTEYEKKRSQMLFDMGYSVFAADLYGAGVRPKEVKDKKKKTKGLYNDRKTMRKLLNGALATAKTQGLNTNNAAVIGYCFGGASVLEMARSGANLKAFISFHGGLATPEGQDYKNTKGQVIVYHGSADTSVTIDQFADLAGELEQAKIPHEMITYSGAPHAFSVFGSKRYRKDADLKSWAHFSNIIKTIIP